MFHLLKTNVVNVSAQDLKLGLETVLNSQTSDWLKLRPVSKQIDQKPVNVQLLFTYVEVPQDVDNIGITYMMNSSIIYYYNIFIILENGKHICWKIDRNHNGIHSANLLYFLAITDGIIYYKLLINYKHIVITSNFN
jgi:hypothetical protein